MVSCYLSELRKYGPAATYPRRYVDENDVPKRCLNVIQLERDRENDRKNGVMTTTFDWSL